MTDEQIIKENGLIDREDYTIEEQIEDIRDIIDYERREKEGTLKFYPIEDVFKEFKS